MSRHRPDWLAFCLAVLAALFLTAGLMVAGVSFYRLIKSAHHMSSRDKCVAMSIPVEEPRP